MLVCKGLGVCCARLPRRAPGTAGARAEEGRGHARQQGQGRARAASAARSAVYP